MVNESKCKGIEPKLLNFRASEAHGVPKMSKRRTGKSRNWGFDFGYGT